MPPPHLCSTGCHMVEGYAYISERRSCISSLEMAYEGRERQVETLTDIVM